jgi:hypothetical protein
MAELAPRWNGAAAILAACLEQCKPVAAKIAAWRFTNVMAKLAACWKWCGSIIGFLLEVVW